MDITRRGLLRWLGLGAAAAALPRQASAVELPSATPDEPPWMARDEDVEALSFDGRTFFVAVDDGFVWSRDGVTWTQHDDMSPLYVNGELAGVSRRRTFALVE